MNNSEDLKLKNIISKILKKADLVDDEKFGSVIAILMMISIVLTVIRVIQECNKNKIQTLSTADQYVLYGNQIRSSSKKRGWFTRMRLKKILRNKLPPEVYAEYHNRLVEAIMDVGENLTEDEVITLVEASNV